MKISTCFWCGGSRSYDHRFDACATERCKNCRKARGHNEAEHKPTSIRNNVRKALKRRGLL